MRMPLTALFLAALLTPEHADDPPAPTPSPLAVAERVYDAGKIDRGVTLRHTFMLKNVGSSELSIDAKPG